MKALRQARLAWLPAAMFVLLVASPLTAHQAEAAMSVPVTGTVVGGGTFEGVLDIQKFVVKDGVLQVIGKVSGVLTTATGKLSIVKTILAAVTIVQTSCDILHLEIGPISLDLLGLNVDLSKIVLDIDAEAGAGNLLGNLLCAVAGLLDNPSGLAKLLNQILAALA